MSFLVPSPSATAPSGVYGTSGSSLFEVGNAGVGAVTSVFVVNDQVSNGAGTFDGVIYSLFGGGVEYFGPATPFDGSVSGITLIAESVAGTGGVFTDTRLPKSIDLNQFPQRFASIDFGDPLHPQAVRGTVDRLYINDRLVSTAVPEPSTPALLAATCSLLGLGVGVEMKLRRPNKIAPHEPPPPVSLSGSLLHRTPDSLTAPVSGGGR